MTSSRWLGTSSDQPSATWLGFETEPLEDLLDNAIVDGRTEESFDPAPAQARKHRFSLPRIDIDDVTIDRSAGQRPESALPRDRRHNVPSQRPHPVRSDRRLRSTNPARGRSFGSKADRSSRFREARSVVIAEISVSAPPMTPAKRDRPVCICDDEHRGIQFTLDAIQRRDLFIQPRAADDDLAAFSVSASKACNG